MATLNPGNIVNGNTIQTSDLLQLYKAFGTGSGDSITGLAMTGSLNGNASTATTATTATSASNITTAITGGGTHYLTFVNGAGTRAPKIASLLEYTANTNTLQVTASRAVTASYALNAATPSNTVTVSAGSGEITPLGDFSMKAFAGITDAFVSATPNTQSVSMSLAFPNLTPSTAIGTDLWVNATPLVSDINITQPIFVSYNNASKVLTFETLDTNFNGQVVYTGYAK